MYLKNPNPKVSYSFRINPELLDNLKLYAKATNQTVPKVITDLITEKLDGITLKNDYLDNYKTQTITIPDIQEIYDNTNTLEMLETMDLQNPFLEGDIFTVFQIPNNLDVWDNTDGIFNQHGYPSYNYPTTLHEGIEFVLAPELLRPEHITDDKVKTQMLLENTLLLPIWFKININDTITIELITFREALEKVKQANNFTLMDKLSHFQVLTKDVISRVIADTPDNEIYDTLQKELYKLTKVINTGNIFLNIPKKEFEPLKDDKVGIIASNNLTDLIEENKILKERVQELETQKTKLEHRFDNIEEELEQIKNNITWEDVMKEY